MEKFNNKPNKSYNTEDGIIWNARSSAVVCHIWAQVGSKYYVLVGKRGTGGDNVGKLNIPCGYIDWNENLYQATLRELEEETGFDLTSIDYFDSAYLKQPWYVNTDPRENRQNIALHTFSTFNVDVLPKLSLENMEENEVEWVKWMDSDDLLKTKPEDWAFDHLDCIYKCYEHFGL